jgi:hypothetical protein
MKLKNAVLLLLASITAPLFAADAMTDAERDALVAHLERTAARFEKSIDGLTEAQWNWKAAPERWSAGEAAEHIVTSEGFIRAMIEPAMKETQPAAMLEGARKEGAFEKMMLDRSTKFQAPEPLKPVHKYTTSAAALEAFRAERKKTIEFVKSGDLRLHAASHPIIGVMDAYSWVSFLNGHSERHTLQIEEVTSDAKYPK